jgi:hypothetical protein
MRFQSNKVGIKFQIQELMVAMGALSHSVWDNQAFGITLVSLGILGAIFRTAFEIAEKTKVLEEKNAESEKIKSASAALADAFGNFGKSSSGES